MRLVRFGVIFVTCVGLSAAMIAGWLYLELGRPVASQTAGSPFLVTRGERLDEILNDLQRHGIIRSALALRLYLKWYKQSPTIQAGYYSFDSSADALAVLEKLRQGGRFDRLTVIEGWTIFDIAGALVRLPTLKLSGSEQALHLLKDASGIHDIDERARTLEGYLFPDTYFLLADMSASELVADMVHNFRHVFAAKLSAKARKAGISVHDAVTIASIIETEAKLESERPIIASVIRNRLKKGMPLSMDSTVVYASKLAGKWKNDGKVYMSDVDRDSPYNTRKVSGLPPGPVGCPGLSCLTAAVTPAATDYLFYVRNPLRADGAHNFYRDEQGFAQGVKALRAWEKSHK